MRSRLPSGGVNPEPEHQHPDAPVDLVAARERSLDQVIENAALLAAAVRRGPLDAPIAVCPGWDVRS